MQNSILEQAPRPMMWTVGFSQLLDLDQEHDLEKMRLGVTLDDMLIPGTLLSDNLIARESWDDFIPLANRDIASHVEFLNFCLLIESMVLSQRLILRPPTGERDLITESMIIYLSGFPGNIGLDHSDLDEFMKVGIGYSATTASESTVIPFPFAKAKRLAERAQQRVSRPIPQEKATDFASHCIHNKLAAAVGCTYNADFGGMGLHFRKMIKDRTRILKQLTTGRLNELLGEALNREIDELEMAGIDCELRIPPIAMLVLDRCRGERKKIGEVILDQRVAATDLRRFVSELRAEFREARTIERARKVQQKIERIFDDFTGNSLQETWRATTWSGLMAAFPRSVWDGLSREDIDFKSVFQFIAGKPLRALLDFSRQRNYVYLLDVEKKVRQIEDYHRLVQRVFGVKFEDHSLKKLRSLRIN